VLRLALATALVLTVPAFGIVPAADAAPRSHPLTVAIIAPPQLLTADRRLAEARLRSAGVTAVRTTISWYGTAPAKPPARWNPRNPNDRHYRWAAADATFRRLIAAGFEPIVAVNDSPVWARLHPEYNQSPPRASAFGAFLHAAALRYSGHRRGLPRVRYWQIWIEPNLTPFFTPQLDPKSRQFTSPDIYRAMVNAAYRGIHSAARSDVVVAGATAPFRDLTPEVVAVDEDWGPLKFMRRVLCLSDTVPLRPTCTTPVHFDVWSTHPYTSGGPTHRAILPYDISLGDLPKWRATLRTAARLGHAVSDTGRIRYWVTEFSWDSNPPDPCAPPIALLRRWVPEALYWMWVNRIDLVTWLQLEDEPTNSSYFQSGLYYAGDSFAAARRKPFVQGLRFPFVALRRGSAVAVWARTPFARGGAVAIEQGVGGRWKPVAQLRADANGIVQATLKVQQVGSFRAVFAGLERSLPFAIDAPPDQFFNPFGLPSLLEPSKTPVCSQRPK